VASAAASIVIETASGDVGDYLTGTDGMTLYTFKPDEELVSTCEAACADAWPPLIVEDGASVAAGDGVTGSLETFERPDGSMQVAYDGAPLYYFARDTAPGEVNGHGAGDAWFVAVP
jgi:predicted lipoprotein with Yx(FWY)xxD motif